MPITVNKPVHTALHRREADGSATPLHPGTCADMVAYVNTDQAAAFDGATAREALDVLFRRMVAVEAGGGGGSVTPPSPPNPQPDPDAEYIIATPRIVTPASGAALEDGAVSLASSRFAMTRGKDTHGASEWRVAGADGRTLWNSGETTQRLTSWPHLPVDATTLTGLATSAGTDSERILDAAPLPGNLPLPLLGGVPAMPPLVAVCCGGDVTLLGAPASSSSANRLWSTGGVTNGLVRLDGLFRLNGTTGTVTRVAYAGAEVAAVLWTGQRLLAFALKADGKTVRVLESTSLGDGWNAVTEVAGENAITATGFVVNALDGVVVLAFGSGSGVFASTDEGRTWTRADLSDALPAGHMVTGFLSAATSPSSLTAHGWLFLGVTSNTSSSGAHNSRWIATRDGATWRSFVELSYANGPTTLVFEDATGVVFLKTAVSGANVTLTLTRLSGDNLETLETLPARTVNAVSNAFVSGAAWDSATGLYVIALSMPTSSGGGRDFTLMGTDPGDLASFTQGVVNEAFPGVDRLYLNGTLRIGGRDFWMARVETGTPLAEWPMTGKSGYRLLRPRLAGVLETETLNAAVRHKAATSGQWSPWSDYVPFTGRVRESGGMDGMNGFLQTEGATFTPEVNSTGFIINSGSRLFTVPEGVTELVILCVGCSSTTGKGGWAASCRVTVTEKQSLSITLTNPTVSVTSMDGTALLSCDMNGVTCAGGELMRVNCGADGNAGVNYLSDADWLAFALRGGAPQTLGSGFPAFGAPYSTASGAPNGGKPSPGLVKIWWGDQIAGA